MIEAFHILKVIPHIDQESWLLVDLDNTLFEATQALGHAYWFYDEVNKKIEQGRELEEAIRELYPLWIKIQNLSEVKPLEADFIPTLLKLQKQKIILMGLTHRQPPVADATLRQVHSLGFNFIETAPSKESFDVPAKSPAVYKQGILFVSDYNKKIDVFCTFLKVLSQTPKKVVYIDDKKKNVEELQETLLERGIEYIGVHYRAIEKAQPVYVPEIAEFQFKYLDKIMSNEAALLLMDHGF